MTYTELLTYDPESGVLTWKPRPRDEFKNAQVFKAWNKTNANKAAGSRLADSEKRPSAIHVSIYGKPHKAHRIIWTMLYGPIPEGMTIDHINRDPWDNRLSNLRLATKSENQRNRAASRRNKLRLKGVSRQGGTCLFLSHISIDGTPVCLGSFPTKGLAAVAYAKAALRHHGEFARITTAHAQLR